jgi:hypothetical protein
MVRSAFFIQTRHYDLNLALHDFNQTGTVGDRVDG